jgi:hypothetical protein
MIAACNINIFHILAGKSHDGLEGNNKTDHRDQAEMTWGTVVQNKVPHFCDKKK